MNKIIIGCFIAAFFLLSGTASAATVPHSLGGFVLGDKIEKCRDQLREGTVMPIRHMECLKEVEAKEIEGFKSGLIYYGTCTAEKRIIRIKLKYQNPSKEFFKQLLNKYKERFGEPDEWRGDPFHVRLAWKWYFTDKDNNHIGLILQHNTQVEGEKIGNSVKLTHSDLLDAEYECCERQREEAHEDVGDRRGIQKRPLDWDQLLPE